MKFLRNLTKLPWYVWFTIGVLYEQAWDGRLFQAGLPDTLIGWLLAGIPFVLLGMFWAYLWLTVFKKGRR